MNTSLIHSPSSFNAVMDAVLPGKKTECKCGLDCNCRTCRKNSAVTTKPDDTVCDCSCHTSESSRCETPCCEPAPCGANVRYGKIYEHIGRCGQDGGCVKCQEIQSVSEDVTTNDTMCICARRPCGRCQCG